MNEFEAVQNTINKILDVLNESRLPGMTIYYMLGDIQNMVKEQIMHPIQPNEGAGVTEKEGGA